MDRTQVFSYGGGKQSVAIALMIAQGKLPKPDYIVIADTGREAQSTWDYMDEVVNPMLAKVGLKIDIAPHSLATVDLYGKNGDLLMPMFTTQSGELGKLPTFCSNEWKQRVVARWLREQGVKQCDLWMGFTLDEIHRVKDSPVKWMRRVYPLLGMPFDWEHAEGLNVMSRADAIRIVDEAGLPEPMKSACFMCPLRNNTEWKELRERYPKEFRKAVALERSLRAKDPHVYVHPQAVPLDEVDFDQNNPMEDEQCSLGFCMI